MFVDCYEVTDLSARVGKAFLQKFIKRLQILLGAHVAFPGRGSQSLAITIHTLVYLLLAVTIAWVVYKVGSVVAAKGLAQPRFRAGGRTHCYRWIDAVPFLA
jgi:hypothetical protein